MYVKSVIQKFTGEVTNISGGYFNYKDLEIDDLIDILQEDEYPTEQLEKLLTSVMNILHAYDWFQCGDTGEEGFKKVYHEEIKNIKELK